GGQPALWVRSLGESEGKPIAGAEGAFFPFWSPDSRSIAFSTTDGLYRVDAAGGAILKICDSGWSVGGAWNRDGVILFPKTPTSSLYRVPASGGVPTPVTKLDAPRHVTAHRYPSFLPDGNHFLYMAANLSGPADDPGSAIRVGSLDGSIDKPVVPWGTSAQY